jgi:hypothetical protein
MAINPNINRPYIATNSPKIVKKFISLFGLTKFWIIETINPKETNESKSVNVP